MKEKNIQELAIRMGLISVEDMCQYTIAQLVYMIANKLNELIVNLNFSTMFGLDKKEVYSNRSKILSFGSATFKKNLKVILDKVLFERLTITELDSLVLEEDSGPKKELRP